MLKINLFLFILLCVIHAIASEMQQQTGRIRFTELYRELSGSHLRFSANNNPPFMAIKKDSNGNFSYSGVAADLSGFIADLINVSHSFVHTRDEEENKVGATEASFNLIARGEVDMIAHGFTLNLNHCDRVDCSHPLTNVPYGLMVPWPEETIHLTAPIEPFQPMVWFWLLISLTVMIFALIWIPGLYLKIVQGANNQLEPINSIKAFNNATIYLLIILTNHGSWSRFKQLSFRILMGTWCLSAVVIVNAYSTTITSYLMAPKLQPVSKTFEELAAGYPQNLKIITEKNQHLATEYFLVAESGAFKILGDSLRDQPETLFITGRQGSKLMDSGHYAYAAMEFVLDAFVQAANKRAGYCRFTISNKNLPISAVNAVFGFAKHWRYTDATNLKIQVGWESGIFHHLIEIHQKKTEKCLLQNYQTTKPNLRKLSLVDLAGPFVVLGLGFSLSLLAFLVELLCRHGKELKERMWAAK